MKAAMTDEQWAEIGAALRKANDCQQSFIDVSEHPWFSSGPQLGSKKPHEFSWLTRKLFGWLLKDAD